MAEMKMSDRDRGLLNRFALDPKTFEDAARATQKTGNLFAPDVLKKAKLNHGESGISGFLKKIAKRINP